MQNTKLIFEGFEPRGRVRQECSFRFRSLCDSAPSDATVTSVIEKLDGEGFRAKIRIASVSGKYTFQADAQTPIETMLRAVAGMKFSLFRRKRERRKSRRARVA